MQTNQHLSLTDSEIKLVTLSLNSLMNNSKLKTLVGSLFTVIINAIRRKLNTIASMNNARDLPLTAIGLVDQDLMGILHNILDASSIVHVHSDVADYVAGAIEDAIIGGD